jgi:hypothetical protein
VRNERVWVLISAGVLLVWPAFTLWVIFFGWPSPAARAIAVAGALVFAVLVFFVARGRWKDIEVEGGLNEVEP